MIGDGQHILAIDQSTSATKAFVYDLRGEAKDRFSVEHRPIYPRPAWVEHDAEELWNNTRTVIDQAAAKHRRYPLSFAYESAGNVCHF